MFAAGWARSHFFRVCWYRSTLPLGLRVIGASVLLCDAEDDEFSFEAVAAAALPGSEDHSVVGQRGFGDAVGVDGGAETLENDGAGDGGVGGEADDVSGVVVEEGEDLGVLA